MHLKLCHQNYKCLGFCDNWMNYFFIMALFISTLRLSFEVNFDINIATLVITLPSPFECFFLCPWVDRIYVCS